ncbi:MAG: hypothetical protein WCK03_03650 [Candidatus Taylorbacteria bacterium]
MNISKQLSNMSHHAYAVIGGHETNDSIVRVLVSTRPKYEYADQDLFNKKYSVFTIDDAREVKAIHLTRPVILCGLKIFILEMDNITIEAQNALLKLLEEPAEYARFFLIIPSLSLLLPTVISRLSIIDTEINKNIISIDEDILIEARKFIEIKPAKRLEMVKQIVDKITKEKIPKHYMADLLDAIQYSIYKEKGIKDNESTFRTIEISRKYMNDRSPSLKMLMEYVAVNI